MLLKRNLQQKKFYKTLILSYLLFKLRMTRKEILNWSLLERSTISLGITMSLNFSFNSKHFTLWGKLKINFFSDNAIDNTLKYQYEGVDFPCSYILYMMLKKPTNIVIDQILLCTLCFFSPNMASSSFFGSDIEVPFFFLNFNQLFSCVWINCGFTITLLCIVQQ